MCLYNYNNKLHTNKNLNNDEYELLNKIYKSISENDTSKVKDLTQQLLSLQTSEESIQILQNSLNSLQ